MGEEEKKRGKEVEEDRRIEGRKRRGIGDRLWGRGREEEEATRG